MAERRTPMEPVALLLAGLSAPPRQDDPLAELYAPAVREPDRGATVAEGAPPGERGSVGRPVAIGAATDHLADLDARVEAVLVAAGAPLSLPVVATAVDAPVAVVRRAVERLRDDYDGLGTGRRRGFELREAASGWGLFVRAEHDEAVRALLEEEEAPSRLSQAALETLAVVAYRQPVSRGQVAAIRAVSVDSVMRTLHTRGLIREVGTTEAGAVLWGTTEQLLDALGIRSLDDLPPIAPLLDGADRIGDADG